MRRILLVMFGLGLLPIFGSVWAITDISTIGTPDVITTSNSGPPGTRITITISHIPDISKISYPYPDLYIYLPFSQSLGSSIASHCGGLDCFPVYTHDQALNHDFADRIITFSLPSTSNPKPVFLNGLENSVCDIIVNGKTVERFSTLCNTKDEPQGTYQIRLAWTLESDLSQRYVVSTTPFTVTNGIQTMSPMPTADNGNTLLEEYQNGTISQSKFYSDLKAKGWTDEQIRQALAVIGKLPHQMGIQGPDDKIFSQSNASITSNIPESVVKKTNTVVIESHNITSPVLQQKQNNSSNSSTLVTLTVQPQTTPTITVTSQNNNLLSSGIIIGLSIAAGMIMIGVTIFVKTQRGKSHAR